VRKDADMEENKKKILELIAALAFGSFVWLASTGLSSDGRIALALTMTTIVLWVREVYPVEITAILLCTAYVVMGAATATDAFSGYGNSIVWFIFAALVFGTAIESTGIGKRIAYGLILRFSGTSFKSMMAIIVAVGAILSFVTPAGVERLLVLYPVAIGVAAVFVKENVKESNIGKLAMAIAYLAGNTFGFGILTGMAVNVLGVGIIKQNLGIEVYWSQWIYWFGLPVMISTLIAIFIVWKLFPPEAHILNADQKETKAAFSSLGPMSSLEKRALLYLLITLALWATDRFHQLPPWGVAIFSAALFCGPGFGVVTREQLSKIQFPIVVFSGAAVTIGTVLSKTGVATWMGNLLLGFCIKPGVSGPLAGAITYLAGAIVHIPLVESMTAVSAFTPAVATYFQSLELPALGPSLMAIMSADTVAFFPYMVMPFLALMGLGFFTTRDAIKVLSSYTLVAIVVQVVSCFTWYHWIGLL
jgi:anion transporter